MFNLEPEILKRNLKSLFYKVCLFIKFALQPIKAKKLQHGFLQTILQA